MLKLTVWAYKGSEWNWTKRRCPEDWTGSGIILPQAFKRSGSEDELPE